MAFRQVFIQSHLPVHFCLSKWFSVFWCLWEKHQQNKGRFTQFTQQKHECDHGNNFLLMSNFTKRYQRNMFKKLCSRLLERIFLSNCIAALRYSNKKCTTSPRNKVNNKIAHGKLRELKCCNFIRQKKERKSVASLSTVAYKRLHGN